MTARRAPTDRTPLLLVAALGVAAELAIRLTPGRGATALAVAFLLVGPGLALLVSTATARGWLALVGAIPVSVAIETAASVALLMARWWQPDLLRAVLVAVTVLAAATTFLRTGDDR